MDIKNIDVAPDKIKRLHDLKGLLKSVNSAIGSENKDISVRVRWMQDGSSFRNELWVDESFIDARYEMMLLYYQSQLLREIYNLEQEIKQL